MLRYVETRTRLYMDRSSVRGLAVMRIKPASNRTTRLSLSLPAPDVLQLVALRRLSICCGQATALWWSCSPMRLHHRAMLLAASESAVEPVSKDVSDS